jgi:hypothetical protein
MMQTCTTPVADDSGERFWRAYFARAKVWDYAHTTERATGRSSGNNRCWLHSDLLLEAQLLTVASSCLASYRMMETHE